MRSNIITVTLGLLPLLAALLLWPPPARETIAGVVLTARANAAALTATPAPPLAASAVAPAIPTVAVPPVAADLGYPAPPASPSPAAYQAPATPDLFGTPPPTPEHGCSDWARWDQYTWQWVLDVWCW